MIERPSIIVTSIGRTGTEFFANLFADIIPDCTSLHEPDIIKFPGVSNRLRHYSQQVQRAGLWKMIFLKSLGKWTLANLSDARFLGILDENRAAKNLLGQRMGFISKQSGAVYIESNLGYYGLLDVIPHVFKHHRTIYIIRDGRDWVRSNLNWGEVYGKKGIRKWFAHKWPVATDIPGDPFANEWDNLSRFEQLCWVWSKLNTYALETISKNQHARVFRFEKIFMGVEKYQYYDDMLRFATDIPGINPEQIGSVDGRLEQRVHQSSTEFPGWENWTIDQKHQFEKICGPLMEMVGYKF